MRTQTDVHFLKVWETERNLHHKWLPLRITKETLTFGRYFLPKAVLSNASLLYMTRSDVFVCEAERNKNICHVNEIYFYEFYPMQFCQKIIYTFYTIDGNLNLYFSHFIWSATLHLLIIFLENSSDRKATLSTDDKQKSLNWVF